MWYAVTQHNVKTKVSLVVFLSQDINATRDFCKAHINNIISIKNDNVDDELLKVKVCYEDNNKKLVIFKNIKEIKTGYIYNSEVITKSDVYYYTITFLGQKCSRLIRITNKNNFNDPILSEFKKIEVTDNKNIHKQLINELNEVFEKKKLNIE